MIVGTLEYCERYYAISDRIKQAFEWLKTHDISQMETGRYELDENKLVVLVQRYTTRIPSSDDIYFEKHEKYIDIHCIIKGAEYFGYTPLARAGQPVTEYDPVDDDFLFAKDIESNVLLREGDFALVFPEDVHVGQCKAVFPCECLKACMKVAVD